MLARTQGSWGYFSRGLHTRPPQHCCARLRDVVSRATLRSRHQRVWQSTAGGGLPFQWHVVIRRRRRGANHFQPSVQRCVGMSLMSAPSALLITALPHHKLASIDFNTSTASDLPSGSPLHGAVVRSGTSRPTFMVGNGTISVSGHDFHINELGTVHAMLLMLPTRLTSC